MIDHQSQMALATKSIDAVILRNNAALVAHAARISALRATANITLASQYVHFEPGRALARIGGRQTDFVFVSATYKF